MNNTKIDLHMHSIYSNDGDYEPYELVQKAKAAGLEVISISDHNTTSAVEAAMREGEKLGVRVISAVELDCIFKGIVFHVLGYGINPNDPELKKIDLDIRQQEKAAAKERIRLVNELGIELDETEALSHAVDGIFVTGELIAELVLNKPKACDNPKLRPYLTGGERSDNPYVNFYWDYCSQGKPAYVHIEYITMQYAIEIIHNAGGLAVLAHPGKNLEGRREMLEDIVSLGMDGIECYSSYHDLKTNEFFLNKANEFNLLVTGGSDYHGKTKPSINMGEFGLMGDGLDLILDMEEYKKKK